MSVRTVTKSKEQVFAQTSVLDIKGYDPANPYSVAPDEELAGLVARAITEHLSPDDIKKAVQNWKADDHRV